MQPQEFFASDLVTALCFVTGLVVFMVLAALVEEGAIRYGLKKWREGSEALREARKTFDSLPPYDPRKSWGREVATRWNELERERDAAKAAEHTARWELTQATKRAPAKPDLEPALWDALREHKGPGVIFDLSVPVLDHLKRVLKDCAEAQDVESDAWDLLCDRIGPSAFGLKEPIEELRAEFKRCDANLKVESDLHAATSRKLNGVLEAVSSLRGVLKRLGHQETGDAEDTVDRATTVLNAAAGLPEPLRDLAMRAPGDVICSEKGQWRPVTVSDAPQRAIKVGDIVRVRKDATKCQLMTTVDRTANALRGNEFPAWEVLRSGEIVLDVRKAAGFPLSAAKTWMVLPEALEPRGIRVGDMVTVRKDATPHELRAGLMSSAYALRGAYLRVLEVSEDGSIITLDASPVGRGRWSVWPSALEA